MLKDAIWRRSLSDFYRVRDRVRDRQVVGWL